VVLEFAQGGSGVGGIHRVTPMREPGPVPRAS
jgi:hypothetical protein